MPFNEDIIKDLNNIYKLTENLYINNLNNLNNNNKDIDVYINYIQTQIYNVNYLKSQLTESFNKLNKIKQENCQHQYKHDNINYEPMQIVCINCNKLFR
jgi:formylmethanofuran dehydrogenase subunit E